MPLTIKEHVDGEWIIEKVVLKELTGERNEQVEKEIPHDEMFKIKRIDVEQRRIRVCNCRRRRSTRSTTCT